MLKKLSQIKKPIDIHDFTYIFYQFFDRYNWHNDILDFIYFLQSLHFVTLQHHNNGKINFINILRKNIKPINNFNDYIKLEWIRPIYEEYYKYVVNITHT